MKLISNLLANFQSIGRALMLPIAVLPVAGLLLRLGQSDLLNIPFIAASGNAIFSHLGLLFAIGVAVGIAKENNGAAGLAGAVAFVVLTEGAKVLLHVPADISKITDSPDVSKALIEAWKSKEIAKLSVPAGIISGLTAGFLYNRYHNIKVPEYLAFFGGRRFVPIAAGFAGILGAMVFGFGFEYLEKFIDALSEWVVKAGPVGLFAYGVLNRLLIVTGLHHVLNNLAWFILGDYNGVTGDLNRFFSGDPSAGTFMSGFFPVMMFGLPAACLAMYRAALPEKRRGLAGMFISLALTSFLTGVTEPIEFTFMFLAPVLYALHAILTGAAMAIMDILDIRLGFGFSAGLFDYVLNFKLATKPLLLIPIGIIYSLIYYFSFSFFIKKFNLMTPGREIDIAENDTDETKAVIAGGLIPDLYIAALGGAKNLANVDACTTRLRLKVHDNTAINDKALKEIGAIAVMRLDKNSVQVVIGPKADSIAGEIRARLLDYSNFSNQTIPDKSDNLKQSQKDMALDGAVVAAFGGAQNIASVLFRDGRAIISLFDNVGIKTAALDEVAKNKWTISKGGKYHLILDKVK
jgi:PTS system N-acetylglucosamine-specific IIC component